MIINLARSTKTEIVSEDNTYIHQEFRLKRITQDEYSILSWRYRKDISEQGDLPAILERRTMRTVAGVEQPQDWELFDLSGKAAHLLLNRTGHDFIYAEESLHPIHASLKSCLEASQQLNKEKADLEYCLEPEMYSSDTRLQSKYKEEFISQLKRARLHKAWKENRANTAKVEAIQAQVTAEYRVERDRITTRLDAIAQELATLTGNFEAEVYELLAEKPEDLKYRVI